IALKHTEIPFCNRYLSRGIKAGRYFPHNRLGGRYIAVSNDFEVGKVDPAKYRIWCNLQQTIETCDTSLPITHRNMIVGGIQCNLGVARIQVQRALRASERFAPATLQAIDRGRVPKNLGVIRRGRRGSGKLL